MPQVRPSELERRTGTLQFGLLNLVRTVTFESPMPDANYDLYWATPNVSVSVAVTNKTAAGFTLTLSLNLTTMDLQYIAIERRV